MLPNLREHSAAQQQHAFISIVYRCRTTRRIKINVCFCIEEKMARMTRNSSCEIWVTRWSCSLARGGISTSSARLYFGNFNMKTGKDEKRESAETKV